MTSFNYVDLTRSPDTNTAYMPNGSALSRVTGNQDTNVINVQGEKITADSLVFAGTATVNTPSNKDWASSEVDTATDLITTATTAGLYTGLAVTVTTAGVLPTGLATSTTYYIVYVANNVFGFATTRANALAGTLINLTAAGSGTSTVVPTALAGASVTVQGSFDYAQGAESPNWFDVPNTETAISATGAFVTEIDYLRYGSYRLNIEMTSGMITFSPIQCGIRGGE